VNRLRQGVYAPRHGETHMTSRYTLPLAVMLWLAPMSGAAQSDRTDEFILAEMERQNIPGLSLVVIRNGEIIKARGYGLANIEERVPATPTTVYKIASVSKQFIAAGIMRLVQDSQIGLDDSIREYLDDAPQSWSGITIRHLLTHTSGLARNPPGFDPFEVRPDAELIATAYGQPLRFVPGEKSEYSNLGYFVLAEVITRVAGMSWTEYLSETIFEPLGMAATHPTNTTVAVPERAQGYVDNDELRDAPEWPALRPSGAFLSNVLDLAKWDAALYTDRILTNATRRQMWTPATLADGSAAPYGFGWMLTDFENRKLVYHTGGMPGTRSAFARFTDEALSIIILMNLDDVDIGSIMFGVSRLYLPVTPAVGTPDTATITFAAQPGEHLANATHRPARSRRQRIGRSAGASCAGDRHAPPRSACRGAGSAAARDVHAGPVAAGMGPRHAMAGGVPRRSEGPELRGSGLVSRIR